MGYIGSDPKTNEAVNTAQLVDDSVTNAKIVDNIQFTSVTASVISASSTVTADSFTGTFNGALSSSAQIASNISGSFSQSHLSSKITGIISGAAQLPSGTVSASVLSSPSQGTVRLTTNGVNTDVDTGLQVGDSPTFAGGTISGDFSVGGTLTAQEVHTEFESASILFTSGSTQFGNSLDDNHVFSGSLLITGSLVQLQGGSTKLRFSNDVGAERAFLQLNGTGLNIDTDSFIDFKPNNTFAARIDSSGKLGISTTFGENIASSVNKFAVRSDTSSTHYNMVNIWEHTNTTTGIEQRIGWAFGDDGGAEDGFGFAGYIGVGKQDSWQVDSTRDSYMSFATALNNSVSEKMRIDSSGNVGIGNTVASTINSANNGGRLVIGDGSGNEGMTIYSGNGSGEYGILYFADGTSGASTYQGWLAYFQDVNALTFATSGTERMRIDSSGRVGIGTVSPSGSLHVQAANPTVYITNTTQDGTSTLLRMTEKKEVDGDAGGFLRYVGSNNWFELGTNISGTDTVHIYLPRDGSGRVGIGDSSPSAPLEVGSTGMGSMGYTGTLIAAASASATEYAQGSSATWGPSVAVSNTDTSSTRTGAAMKFIHRGSSSGVAAIVSTSAAADRGDLRFITRGAGNVIDEKVQITEDGYLLSHKLPAFHAYGFAAHVYANSADRDPLKYNSTHYNQGSHYSTSTGKFTAPINGIYFFAMSAMYRHVGGDFHVGIKVNNTSKTISNDHQEYQASGFAGDGDLHTWVQTQSTLVASLAANDYVTCYMGSSTNSGTYLYNSSNYNHFCGFLVG